MVELARRLQNMAPSGTAAVFSRVAALRAQGADIISLSVGEPDFPTPPHIVEAAAEAMRRGATRYTEVPGLRSLREAIVADSKKRRGVAHDISEVVVSTGAKHVLYNLAQVLYDPGDRVLVPVPCWGSYVEQARLCGADVVLIPCAAEDAFLPDLQVLARELALGAKALVLCAPNNPTGALFSRDYLRDLGQLLAGHDCFVIVDEIYTHLHYEDTAPGSLLEVVPALKERLLVVDGVSKAYAMTGFRVGWLLGPEPVVRGVERMQGQATTHVATMCQAAAEAALLGDQGCIATMRDAYRKRRDLICAGLQGLEGVDVFQPPAGAFYVFAGVGGLLGKSSETRILETDLDIAHWLLEEAGVAVVPGAAFFAPGHIRLSYATSEAQISEALSRMQRAIARLT